MNSYEEKARNLKESGKNCSESLYETFKDELHLGSNFPMPRSIEGKCGALLTSLFILDEMGMHDKKEEFENEFMEKFGYNKCMQLMAHGAKCTDYVGESAKLLDKMINGK